jgi:hypothetical protein
LPHRWRHMGQCAVGSFRLRENHGGAQREEKSYPEGASYPDGACGWKLLPTRIHRD